MMTLDDIKIRTELKPGDMGYVIHLHGKLYFSEYQYGLPFESYVAASIHEFMQQYNPVNSRVWICEHHENIIGFLALMNRNDAAQLRYFLIEPAYRGIKLGKKLMDLWMDFYQQCGYQSAYLSTTDELPAALHLYTSYGFQLKEEKDTTTFGKPVREQYYELRSQGRSIDLVGK
jgi:ribosomal protein S18 acetylase RimI-like enzyme